MRKISYTTILGPTSINKGCYSIYTPYVSFHLLQILQATLYRSPLLNLHEEMQFSHPTTQL